MPVDGLRPGAPGPEQQIEQDRVIIPVQEGVVGDGQSSELPKPPEVPTVEVGAIPGGARPLDTPETSQGAVEGASQVVAEVPDSEEGDAEAEQEVVADPVVEADPNAEAHSAITGVGTPSGASTLESIIGRPADKPVEPSGAPVISAFPEKGLDVPSTPVATPVTATSDVAEGTRGFADPYPLPESKPATTPTTGPMAPQTFINTSGLPGTPPPLAAEPQVPVPPVAPTEPVAPMPPETPIAVEEPAQQPESSIETEDPTMIIDEFLAIDPASMIKESGGLADRSSFLLAAQYRDAQIHIKNLRENGWGDVILAPVVKDYKNALEAKSGETS